MKVINTILAKGESFCVAIDTNSGSGGYVEHVFRYAAERQFGVDLWASTLEYKPGRNPDISELELIIDGERKLKFARAYGFRNIQGIVSNLKRDRCDYDFIEIMACPSGCNAGGGQLRGDVIGETPIETRTRTKEVEDVYHASLKCRQVLEVHVVSTFSPVQLKNI